MLRKTNRAFTLAEMLLAIAVLTVFILLVTRLLNSASGIITLAHKRIDADADARPVLDRIAVDLAQMVKRSDVGYYLKNAATPMTGNDCVGFYSMVQGYYPITPSPVSVVAYRVNSDSTNSAAYNRLERMGKGLNWNGASATEAPIVFLPVTIESVWPSVASSSAYDDSDPARRTYEIIAPQVFRFEYYYLDRSTGVLVAYPATWNSPSAIAVNDAAAIVVAIAAIDPRSRVLLSNSQIAMLAGRLPDYGSAMGPGQLLAQWQSALDGITDMPRQAISGVRLYERYFYLSR